MSDINWEMKFDLNTLEHLGVKLYTQYPPMIAELNALKQDGQFEIKSYSDLLTQARSYHKDFINKYDEIMEKKNASKES